MIYGLYNKDTGHVRYVGRTIQKLHRRLNEHRYNAKNESKRTTTAGNWIQKIGRDNVGIILLERSPENESKAEVWWMEYLEFLGCELVNDARFEMKICTSSGIDVTDKMKSMMGEVPDKVIAKKFDVNRNTILKHRSRLGIESWDSKIELPKECIEQLGDKPDKVLAEEFNMTRITIRRRRLERNINAFYSNKGSKIKLPKKAEEKLGKIPDGVIADRFDLTRDIVRNRRIDKDIDSINQGSNINLPEECFDKLGTKPDNELAEEYDVSSRTICERRQERDIPPFKKSQWNSNRKTGEVKWLAKNSDMTYKEIGKIYDISDANVSNIKNEKRRADVNSVKPDWFGNT